VITLTKAKLNRGSKFEVFHNIVVIDV